MISNEITLFLVRTLDEIQLNVGFERLATELVNNTYNVCNSIAK